MSLLTNLIILFFSGMYVISFQFRISSQFTIDCWSTWMKLILGTVTESKMNPTFVYLTCKRSNTNLSSSTESKAFRSRNTGKNRSRTYRKVYAHLFLCCIPSKFYIQLVDIIATLSITLKSKNFSFSLFWTKKVNRYSRAKIDNFLTF